MAVRIRLRRVGGRGEHLHRIVVADSRSPRDGRFIETIGTYDPRRDPPRVTVNQERATYWLGQGARPSDTVRSLFKRAGVPAG